MFLANIPVSFYTGINPLVPVRRDGWTNVIIIIMFVILFSIAQ